MYPEQLPILFPYWDEPEGRFEVDFGHSCSFAARHRLLMSTADCMAPWGCGHLRSSQVVPKDGGSCAICHSSWGLLPHRSISGWVVVSPGMDLTNVLLGIPVVFRCPLWWGECALIGGFELPSALSDLRNLA